MCTSTLLSIKAIHIIVIIDNITATYFTKLGNYYQGDNFVLFLTVLLNSCPYLGNKPHHAFNSSGGLIYRSNWIKHYLGRK